MPFTVTYRIYEMGKQAPCLTTQDRVLAHIQFNEMCRRQDKPLVRFVHIVEPVEPLTKPERYLYLVYQVRKAIRKYYGEGRKKEDLDASLALEKQLDDWNTRTRFHLQTHPKCKPDDEKAFAFFQVVEEWRTVWKKYFAYKKRADRDQAVEREMKKQCFDFEKLIDEYITKTIGI